jgi:hypothetical protein
LPGLLICVNSWMKNIGDIASDISDGLGSKGCKYTYAKIEFEILILILILGSKNIISSYEN